MEEDIKVTLDDEQEDINVLVDDGRGPKGDKGDKGDTGPEGSQGPKGEDGKSATIKVGTVTTLEAGSNATVENVGTETEAIFNFGIPKGEDGTSGTDGTTDYTYLINKPSINNVELEGNKTLDQLGIQAKGDYAKTSDILTKVSQLTNDSGYITEENLNDYTSTKTVRGESITIKDAVEYKLLNLEIDGKSVQNGEPTPTTPIEIKSVGTYNEETGKYEVKVKTVGKNLFDGVFRQGNPKDLDVLDRLFNENNFKLKGNQSYTISTNLDTSIFRYAVNLNVNEFPIVSIQNFYDSGWKTVRSFTFTPSQDCYFGIVLSRIAGGNILPTDISSYWFMLEEGSTSTEYEEHKSNTTVLELNEPLRSLPNGVKDIAYIKNNKLYVDRYVGSVVLDGSESWSTYSSQKLDNTSYFLCTIDLTFNSTNNFYSSHFVFAHIWGNDVVGLYLETTNVDNIRMRVPNSIASTPEELKTWLSNNNVLVDYELATPVTEEVGDCIIYTYAGVNNIDLEAGLKTEFSVTYALGMYSILPTKVSQLENDCGYITENNLKVNGIKDITNHLKTTSEGLLYIELSELPSGVYCSPYGSSYELRCKGTNLTATQNNVTQNLALADGILIHGVHRSSYGMSYLLDYYQDITRIYWTTSGSPKVSIYATEEYVTNAINNAIATALGGE